MNLGELRAMTANFCEDTNISKFTAAKYNTAINQAQKQFCLDSKVLYKEQAYVLAVDDATYDLPTDFILDKAVRLNGIPLDPISKDKLDENYRSTRWDTIKGTPSLYIVDPMEANKTLRLFPIPSDIGDGTDLRLVYYCKPADMATDISTPFNSATLMGAYEIAIANYAAWLLLSYLTPTDAIVSKRKDMLSQYTEKVIEAVQEFGDTKTEPISLHPENIRIR